MKAFAPGLFISCCVLGCSSNAGDAPPPLRVVDRALMKPVKAMAASRYAHASVLLSTGKVLVTGGFITSGGTTTTEIYDPIADTWAAGPPNAIAHINAAAVTLTDGRVLVIGNLAAAELFDPTTSAWSSGGTLTTARQEPAMVRLLSGKVLAVGGNVSTAEVFDPTTKAWTATGSMAGQRSGHRVALMTSGKVLVVGGIDWSSAKSLSRAEIWDPTAGTWTTTTAMTTDREVPMVATLADGRVLVAGGKSGNAPSSTVEVYDPTAKTWTRVAPMTVRRAYGQITTLGTGRLLVTGGSYGDSSVEIYEPSADRWVAVGNQSLSPTLEGSATLLPTGGVLTVGGRAASSPSYSNVDLFTLQAAGTACTKAIDCANLQCVDGVCCDTACTGSCQACDVTGKVGTCTLVDGPPHGTRGCGAYFKCTAGVCATTCTVDTECAKGNYCSGGSCVATHLPGETCSRGAECGSGFCADGVCCNTACTEQCAACDGTATKGTCTPQKGLPKGARAACVVGAGTECGQQCNGVDPFGCHYLPAGEPACSKNGCALGSETHASTCDGAGLCKDVPKSCGDYVCGVLTCKTSCATKADCKAGFTCNSGVCEELKGLGVACVDTSTCGSGLFCTNNVCCVSATCGAGAACDLGPKKGTCTKNDGIACGASDECKSGNCVDGVCCNVACKGQCEACDTAGAVGTCAPVTGAPHKSRALCADPGDCTGRTCDGSDPSKCSGFVGDARVCAPAACKSGEASASATCNGAGKCGTGKRTLCEPYACGTDACKTSCAAPADCAAGYECQASKCVPVVDATCSADGLSSVARDGKSTACSPYRCSTDGRCRGACASSADCALGFLCSAASCIAPTSPAAVDQGGCALGAKPAPPPATGLLGVCCVAAVAWLRRRRAAPSPLARP